MIYSGLVTNKTVFIEAKKIKNHYYLVKEERNSLKFFIF